MLFDYGIFPAQVVGMLILAAVSAFWLWVYNKRAPLKTLKPLLLPIALFAICGILDFIVTVNGTYYNPAKESDPIVKPFLLGWGTAGFVFITCLWISFCILSTLFLYEFERRKKISKKKSLFLRSWFFYGASWYHLLGFLSWQGIFIKPLSQIPYAYNILLLGTVLGGALALIHTKLYSLKKN
jgi:hypothetical protein